MAELPVSGSEYSVVAGLVSTGVMVVVAGLVPVVELVPVAMAAVSILAVVVGLVVLELAQEQAAAVRTR